MAHAHDLRQLRGDHNDGDALPNQFVYNVIDFEFRADINTACGFIENEHFGPCHQPFAQYNLLLIASAQRTDNRF